MTPKPLLHLEGAAVLVLSVIAYRWNHGGRLELILLFLVPDISTSEISSKPANDDQRKTGQRFALIREQQ